MKKNQKGFGVVGMLLVIMVIGALVGAGWYVAQRDNNDNKKQSETSGQTIKTKPYTDSSKLYAVSYPETWDAKEAEDCCEGAPKDYTELSRSVTFTPSDKVDIRGYGVNVQADSTDSLARLIEQGWAGNKRTPETKTVNGYSAQYVRVAFSGDAENYVDHTYLVTHNGASIFLTFREKYYHQYPAADWSAARDMKAFNGIVNSVRFLE